MTAFLTIIASPAKVTMLLICLSGAAFMIWFLVGLLADQTRVRARYVVRFKLGEERPTETFEDQLCSSPLLDKARPGLQTRHADQFSVQGFRIKQHF